MKNIVSLLALAAVSSFATANLHADTLNGVSVSLVADATSKTVALIDLPSSFFFSDGTSLITAAVVQTPLADVVSVTDVCLSIDKAFCKHYTFSITDANFGGIALGADVSAYAATMTSIVGPLATVDLNGSLALGTDVLVFSGPNAAPPTSPVPEPGTLSLMATGLMGAAGALRRRFIA